ncbi:MAG: hypothetical protein EP338_08525 [Bacteroidetes bacterium]|nr:MAG: hypothetical protein EP338_08525 [Bacteroidota bacterium]
MIRSSLFLGLIVLCTSCSGLRLISQDPEIGKQLIKCPEAGFQMHFYGDYRFQKFRKSTTTSLDRKVIRQFSNQGALQFRAYTVLEPHASAISREIPAISFKQIEKQRTQELKSIHGVSNVHGIIKQFGEITCYEIDFEWSTKNEQLHLIEYYFEGPKKTVQLFFWSKKDLQWLQRETSGIVKSVRLLKGSK